jgi:hypothetical protein
MLRALRKRRRPGRGEEGQSMIEFIMLVPLLMVFLWYMIHVNLAINKSIVGQVAARSQLFLKMYNHRSGPEKSEFGRTDRSHFYIGVSGEVYRDGTKPVAPTEILGIGPYPPKMSGIDDDPGEAEPGSLRQKVRIRSVFGICTHRKTMPDGSGPTDFCGSKPDGS